MIDGHFVVRGLFINNLGYELGLFAELLIEAYCSNKAQFGENQDGFVLITEKHIDGIVKFANQYDLVGELTKSGFVRASIKGGDRWVKIDIDNFVLWVKNKGAVKLNVRGEKDGRKSIVRRRKSNSIE